MRSALLRFGGSVAFLIALSLIIATVRSETVTTICMILFIFVGLTTLILTAIELGKSLMAFQQPSLRISLLRFGGLVILLAALLFGELRIADPGLRAAGLFALALVGLPVLLLAAIDLGTTLRNVDDPSLPIFLLGLLLGVPQAFLGLASMVTGLCGLGWTLYNVIVKHASHFDFISLSYCIEGLALALIGAQWLRRAFVRTQAGSESGVPM